MKCCGYQAACLFDNGPNQMSIEDPERREMAGVCGRLGTVSVAIRGVRPVQCRGDAGA